MFKKLIQNIFKPHAWRLLHDGYQVSDVSKITFKTNYFNKFENNKYCEENSESNNYFERTLNVQLKEFLIVGKFKIKHLLIFDGFIVYSKDYRMNNNYNAKGRFEYVNQMYPKIKKTNDSYIKMISESEDHILLIAKHISKELPIYPFLKRGQNSNLIIKKSQNFKDTYTIVDNIGIYSPDNKNHSFENEVKIIGDYLYSKRKAPYSFQVKNDLLKFDAVDFFELRVVTDTDKLRDCIIEISFNDINFYYMTIKEFNFGKKTNQSIAIFKNKNNQRMMFMSPSDVLFAPQSFKMIYHCESFTTYYTLGNSLFKELANDDEAFNDWLMLELHKTCISKSSRQELGFRLKGELDQDELLVIEALFI
jgi:hypothetical protein